MFYAQLTGGVVTSVTETAEALPESPDLILIDSYNVSLLGSTYNGSSFTTTLPTSTAKLIDVIDFKLRFTIQERVAIYQSTDLIIVDFVRLLEDPRLKNVDVMLQSTIDAVHYLASQNLILPSRVNEILA